jgi:hypothetical protein
MDYGEELKKQRDDAIAKAVNEMKTKMEVDRAVFVASKQASDQFDKDDGYKVALAKAQQMAAQVSSADPQAQVEFMNQLMLNDYPQYLLVSKLMEESAQAQQALDPEQQGQPGQDKPGQGGDGKDPKQQQQNDGEAK